MKKEKEYKAVKGISIKTIGIFISAISAVISGFLIASLFLLSSNYRKVNNYTQAYMQWENVASDIQSASDYLTSEVRSFVVTGKKEHMDHYFYESNVSRRRDIALNELKEHLHGTSVESYVVTAYNESMDLMNQEFYAMRLVSDVRSVDYSTHREIIDVVISDADLALSDEEKLAKASNLVFGEGYHRKKEIITSNVQNAVESLDKMMQDDVNNASKKLKRTMIIQQAFIAVNVIFLISFVFILIFVFLKPLQQTVIHLENDEEQDEKGVKELAYVSKTYNKTYSQNKNIKERLIYEAEHDKLTRLYNRTGYDTIYKRADLSNTVYILIDADNFKQINDEYGHAMGDKVLVRVAKTLNKYFGDDVDANIFRIGGDEFTVLIENFNPKNFDALHAKLRKMNEEISQKSGEIPGISLSIGVAYGKGADTTDTLFRKADKALYYVKKHGRHDVSITK